MAFCRIIMIASATYAIRSGTLTINFSNGNSATYPDTSVITVIQLCRAENPGSFFNSYIRGKPPRK